MSGINPTATYQQTNFTTQTGTVYKTNIDGNNIVAQRVVDNLAVHAQATQNMTVVVDPGHIFQGATLTEIGAQTTLALTNASTTATVGNATGISNGMVVIAAAGVTNNATITISGTTVTLSTAATTTATVGASFCQVTSVIAAPAGNPRIDRIIANRNTGVIAIVTGTPAATPVAPAITSGSVPLSQILLQTSSTSITNSMITDERDTAALGRGTAGEYNVGTAANNVVQLDGAAKLPAVDGSQLTNVGGGLKLLYAVTVSGATNVPFNSTYITSAYNRYVLKFDSLYGSGNADLYLTVSTNNGSTYLSSNYNATGIIMNIGSPGVNGGAPSGVAQLQLTLGNGNGVSSTTTNVASGSIEFSAPAASAQINFVWDMIGATGASTQTMFRGAGGNSGTTPINNIKIAPASGTITGNFQLYGFQKA